MSPRRATRVVAASLAVWVMSFLPSAAGAQPPWLSGYAQAVPLWSDATTDAAGSVAAFTRARMAIETTFNNLAVEVAYEHALTARRRSATTGGFGVGVVPGGGEYLDLQWTVSDRAHLRWQHRFDRLRVGWRPSDAIELSVGRQAVSWGTTLFLTPADPFVPFDPADPFREFRAGVDTVRVRMHPTPLSEIDIVARPTKTPAGEEWTALARGLATWRNWELSGWGGSLYGDAAGAFAAAGAIGAFAVRGEVVLRRLPGETAVRATVGVDHLEQLRGRDLYLIVEYQHDGLGASGAEEYPAVVESAAFRRGELQVLGRDETVAQVSYQLHPLWSVAGLWLWNLHDRSALLAPSVGYSLSNDASLAAGVYFGVGDGGEPASDRSRRSEYGAAGTTVYGSFSWYF